MNIIRNFYCLRFIVKTNEKAVLQNVCYPSSFIKRLIIKNNNHFLFSSTKNKLNSNQSLNQINQKSSQDNLINLLQIQDPQSFIQQQLSQRAKALQLRHKQLQKKLDDNLNFPLKLYGTNDQYQTQFAYLPDRVMSYYRIHSTTITDYLLKIYKASIYAMADDNQSFMNQYWQEGLKNQVRKALQKCKQDNFVMKVKQHRDFVNAINQKCEIVDSIMIRGLSMNRKQNKHPKQYRKSLEHEDVALLTYTPLHLTENSQAFIDPLKNKTVYQDYDKIVLRVLLRIKTPLYLHIDKIPIDQKVCTWQHLCVMQNQMIAPVEIKTLYKLETFMEWLGKFRFGIWKMVDIDNFMKGNSLFREQIIEQPLDPVFKGTKLDKGHYINIRQF